MSHLYILVLTANIGVLRREYTYLMYSDTLNMMIIFHKKKKKSQILHNVVLIRVSELYTVDSESL